MYKKGPLGIKMNCWGFFWPTHFLKSLHVTWDREQHLNKFSPFSRKNLWQNLHALLLKSSLQHFYVPSAMDNDNCTHIHID